MSFSRWCYNNNDVVLVEFNARQHKIYRHYVLKVNKLTKKKIYFTGLLANVDSSILQVKLDHGFQIDYMSMDKGIAFFCALENLPQHVIGQKLFNEYPCYNSVEKNISL